jgi:pyruvate dehydrogenase E1 component alpha subunit
MLTKEELIAFEKDIADTYCTGKIRAPVHLSDGNEEQLIALFKMIHRDDWVFSTWRSHFHALLHGIPKERLKQKILEGDSITLMDAEHHFFATAIVGGNLPIAAGVALAERLRPTGRHVWCFVGDMTAEVGGFHECVKYSTNFDLPITFVIEDNGESVGTPTRTVWGLPEGELLPSMPTQIGPKVWRYSYKKAWPHVGAGKWVTF